MILRSYLSMVLNDHRLYTSRKCGRIHLYGPITHTISIMHHVPTARFSDDSRQNTQSLSVMSLREQVNGTATVNHIPGILASSLFFRGFRTQPHHFSHIPRHGVDIAADIDDPSRVESHDLIQKRLITAFSWRVQDQRRVLSLPT